MADSVKLRRGTVADIPSMMDLERACPSAAHWNQAQYPELFRADGGPERLVLIAEDALPSALADASREATGGMLGFLIARHVAPEWELESIVVAPTARRQGIGARLLRGLWARSRETDSAAVFLEVRESNITARNLYEKTGFREAGRRMHYYADPPEDAVLYRWAIALVSQ